MASPPPNFENERLLIERERLELDKKRFEFEQRFLNRYFATIVTVALSLATIVISATQFYISTKSQAEENTRLQEQHKQENALADKKQQAEWRIKAGTFVAEHAEDVFSNDKQVAKRMILLIGATFPDEIQREVLKAIEQAAPHEQKIAYRVARTLTIDSSAAHSVQTGPSQQSSAPSQQGSVPSQQGSVPSQQGSVPSQQSSAPSQQSSVLRNFESPLYMNMSRRLQTGLKKQLLDSYLNNPSNLRNINLSYVLLTYASLPATTSISVRENTQTQAAELYLNTDKDLYWDWPDAYLRQVLVSTPKTMGELQLILSSVRAKIGGAPESAYYGDSDASRILNIANASPVLPTLLICESITVRDTAQTVWDIVSPNPTQKKDELLQRLSERVSSTYSRLNPIYGKVDVKQAVLEAVSTTLESGQQ